MDGVEQITSYRFSWPTARALFRKRTLRLMFLQGFFGVFPWNVITFWFFTYLEKERGYSGVPLFVTMAAAVLVLAAGYPLGGALGDAAVQAHAARPDDRLHGRRAHRRRADDDHPGRPGHENQGLFLLMLALTALFIPFSAPNVVATVYDITLPEVRSTALAIQYLIESAGAALAPLIAGAIADRTSLGDAILWVSVVAWGLCAFFYFFALAPGAGRYPCAARADGGARRAGDGRWRRGETGAFCGHPLAVTRSQRGGDMPGSMNPNDVRFFSGQSHPQLAAGIAGYLGVPLDETHFLAFQQR